MDTERLSDADTRSTQHKGWGENVDLKVGEGEFNGS
jgi:hypothetical protein